MSTIKSDTILDGISEHLKKGNCLIINQFQDGSLIQHGSGSAFGGVVTQMCFYILPGIISSFSDKLFNYAYSYIYKKELAHAERISYIFSSVVNKTELKKTLSSYYTKLLEGYINEGYTADESVKCLNKMNECAISFLLGDVVLKYTFLEFNKNNIPNLIPELKKQEMLIKQKQEAQLAVDDASIEQKGILGKICSYASRKDTVDEAPLAGESEATQSEIEADL